MTFWSSSLQPRASAEKFPGEEGNGKNTENSKKRPKNSTIKHFPVGEGGQRKNDRKIAKKTEK